MKDQMSSFPTKTIKLCRVSFLFKFAVSLCLLWICIYFYFSSYKSEMLKEFETENLSLENMRQKVADLITQDENQKVDNIDAQRQEPEFNERDRANLQPVAERKDNKLDDGITDEARNFMKQLGLINPGDNGDPVNMPENLTEDIRKKMNEGFETHGYNAFVSNMVSLNRPLPDVRNDICKSRVYKNLPKASIVIPFHNEHWMLLMRTVHSILNRSPPELIEEILLVDDFSDHEDVREKLDEYIKLHPIIRVIRSYRRHGIIVNRMMGALNAVGPILVYVDSHVEVTPGWLEPILDRFNKNPNALVFPKISSIDEKTLQMYLNNEDAGSLGGFAWNMDFNWLDVRDYEGDHPTPMWDPKKSPTIIGAVHAISKKFFMHVGLLDPEFDIWGGEDVELSFKTWLCGGIIEYVPCSYTAHMYKTHKYTWPKSEKGGYRWNTDRIAEVWLDEYKRYYYRLVGDTKDRKFGDISERLAIRKKAGCKPFKWFVDNVYPNVPIPDEIKDTTQAPTTIKVVKAEEVPKNGTK